MMSAGEKISTLINPVFVNQIPGFFGILNLESKFLCVNETGAKWTGFRSSKDMTGYSYSDIKCKAAEHHDLFIKQDKILLVRNRLKFLGHYCYNQDDWKVVFGGKYILKDQENNNFGLVSYFDDVTNDNLIDISRFLFNLDRGFSKKNNKQFCYIIEGCVFNSLLSDRQSQCLFFLIRGKTSKEIAKILHLSFRTVETYVEQVKDKLNCASKSELIEKAIDSGYINVVPEALLEILGKK
jgi:DNA-binding CsgD family transcriptional regulator